MPSKAVVAACRMVLVPMEWLLKLVQLALFNQQRTERPAYKVSGKSEWVDAKGIRHTRYFEYWRSGRR